MKRNQQNDQEQPDDAPPPMITSGFDEDAIADMPAGSQMIARGGVLAQTGGEHNRSMRVIQPRDLQVVNNKLMAEARVAGESFFYGWGKGNDKVEGPSVGLAVAAARYFGNCDVEPLPVEETDVAYFITFRFVDNETGFTMARTFRQSKRHIVHGKMDAARKEDVIFQIGQSKALRNVILNAMPKWMINAAVKAAKSGVHQRIAKYIEANGLPAAQDMMVKQLKRHGVEEKHIFDRYKVADRSGLDIDKLVMLRGDLYALDEGQERAEELFPAMAESIVDAPATGGTKGVGAGQKPNGGGKSNLDKQFDELMNQEQTGEQPQGGASGEITLQAEPMTGPQLEAAFREATQKATDVGAVTALVEHYGTLAQTDADHAMIAGVSEAVIEAIKAQKPQQGKPKNGSLLGDDDLAQQPTKKGGKGK